LAKAIHCGNVSYYKLILPFLIYMTFCEMVFTGITKESVPIQLAQCWFHGLAISSAKIKIYFSNKIYGSNFIKQHSETVIV